MTILSVLTILKFCLYLFCSSIVQDFDFLLVLFFLTKHFLDPAASADLAVVLMQEGLAHIFLIGRRYNKNT